VIKKKQEHEREKERERVSEILSSARIGIAPNLFATGVITKCVNYLSNGMNLHYYCVFFLSLFFPLSVSLSFSLSHSFNAFLSLTLSLSLFLSFMFLLLLNHLSSHFFSVLVFILTLSLLFYFFTYPTYYYYRYIYIFIIIVVITGIPVIVTPAAGWGLPVENTILFTTAKTVNLNLDFVDGKLRHHHDVHSYSFERAIEQAKKTGIMVARFLPFFFVLPSPLLVFFPSLSLSVARVIFVLFSSSSSFRRSRSVFFFFLESLVSFSTVFTLFFCAG